MRLALLRFGLVALGGAVIAAAAAQSPRLLRRLDTFRVQRVEVHGTRYLPPHEALAVSGIGAETSVFDDHEPARRRLLAHPLIAAAEVRRRLPGTLLLVVAEAEPVALLAGDELRAVDARGALLPIDPLAASLDLPVVRAEVEQPEDAERVRDAGALVAVAALTRIRRLEPDLAARVSEADVGPAGALRLRLRDPATATLLLPREPDALRLRQVTTALADLDRRGELAALSRADARFQAQIVVSFHSPKS